MGTGVVLGAGLLAILGVISFYVLAVAAGIAALGAILFFITRMMVGRRGR